MLAALGLGMWAIAVIQARDIVQNWAADRASFSAGVFAMPGVGAFILMLAAVAVRTRVMGRPPNAQLDRWMLRLCVIAFASVVIAFVAGVVVENRIAAAGYSRCPRPGASGKFPTHIWVRYGGTCR